MNSCADLNVLHYLHDELSGQDRERFRIHIESCVNCRARLNEEQALSSLLRQARPLYNAPAELRLRISLMEAQSATSPSRLEWWRRLSSWHLSWKILFPVALVLMISLLIVPNIERKVQAARYVEAAATTYAHYLDGRLRPQIRSSSPEIVTAWLADQLPFQFRLPSSGTTLGATPTYRLVGATLVAHEGKPVAMVMYEAAGKERISLLVASSKYSVVAGGDEVSYGTLIFHYRTIADLRIITWSNHGLSYALASSVMGPVKQSCMVCHQGMRD